MSHQVPIANEIQVDTITWQKGMRERGVSEKKLFQRKNIWQQPEYYNIIGVRTCYQPSFRLHHQHGCTCTFACRLSERWTKIAVYYSYNHNIMVIFFEFNLNILYFTVFDYYFHRTLSGCMGQCSFLVRLHQLLLVSVCVCVLFVVLSTQMTSIWSMSVSRFVIHFPYKMFINSWTFDWLCKLITQFYIRHFLYDIVPLVQQFSHQMFGIEYKLWLYFTDL